MRRLFLALPLLLLSVPARAQAPAISEVFPPGVQAGAGTDATIAGSGLKGADRLLVSGSGLKAEIRTGGDAAKAAVHLTADASAEPGPREIRIGGPEGISNASLVWVGRYPDAQEKEPNDLKNPAQPVEKTPVTLNGRADKAEDVDRYVFTAGAGETWVFELNAAAHRSQLDGFLQLSDERGRVLASAMNGFERDPRLVHKFETAGRYVIAVRDSLYRGGAGYTYRLSLGRLPVVTRYSPMGGQRGTTLNVRLQGVNLAGLTALPVALPASGEELRVVPKTPAGLATPIVLSIGDLPEAAEHEPNDTAMAAGRLPGFPWAVSGCIDRRGDRDTYAFAAKEKEPVLVDVIARRVGSRLDSVVRVRDAKGKELASNDDALGRDARLVFTPPATGEYFAEVRSLSGRGGDEFYYRLELRKPPAPDFSLQVTPDNPAVPAGAATVVTVTARRLGYNGPIQLRLEGLPAGVAVSPAVVAAGQNSALFTLSAPAGTALAGSQFRLVGTAAIDGKNVERVAEGAERYQPPLTNQPQQTRLRATEMTVAAVAAAPPFTVQPAGPAEVKAGQKVEWTVKLARAPMYKEQVAVTLLGLPPNVTASALTLKPDQAEGKITLTTTDKAPPGDYHLVVQGTAKNRVVAAPAAPLKITPK